MQPYYATITILKICLTLILISGCSARINQDPNLPPATLPPAYESSDQNFWWRCQFKIVWPENDQPDWGMDLFLAHSVVAPSLINHGRDISYWRFHRRAARDNAGHQFSFIFFSKPETAASIYMEIQENSKLKQAIEANLVEQVITGDVENPINSNIEDTSDPNWSSSVQKNWPSFIMGVSSLWLGLIDDSVQESPEELEDINLLLLKYREVDAKVTQIWRNEGQHALLHHLNAVFGYNPLFIRKMLTF